MLFLFRTTNYLDLGKKVSYPGGVVHFGLAAHLIKQQLASNVPKKYPKQSRNSVQLALYS